MTPADIEAIRARAEAATPGEWRCTRNARDVATVHTAPTLAFDTEIALLRDLAESEADPSRDHLMADGEFIAHAKSDIPALLDEVERLRKALRDALSLAMELDDEAGWYERYKALADMLAEGSS